MGLLDFFKKAPAPGEGPMGPPAPSSPSSSIQGPPGFGGGVGGMSGMGGPSLMGGSRPSMFGGASAVPMFPQSQPSGPMPGFSREPFSPTAELREVQGFGPQQQSPSVPSDDMGRKISHIEDKMEIINEKLDLILRELRHLYDSSAGRRL